MKYDNTQYYYSPSKNYPWFLEDNKPNDAIKMTLEMEEAYEDGINNGNVCQPNSTNDGFLMVHPDTLLTPEELAQRNLNIKITEAKDLINRTNAFDTISFQSRYMTEEQKTEFETWRNDLFNLAYEDATQLPETPDFVQQLLNKYSN